MHMVYMCPSCRVGTVDAGTVILGVPPGSTLVQCPKCFCQFNPLWAISTIVLDPEDKNKKLKHPKKNNNFK